MYLRACHVTDEGACCKVVDRRSTVSRRGLRTAADNHLLNHTSERFAAALAELLVERDYGTNSGRPNWSAFASELHDVHYETLRRVVTGQRQPSPHLIEESARVLGVRPDYFLEYRLYLARQQLDPAVVGLERAARNLQSWDGARDPRGGNNR
jgi:hypothetical protein